MVREQIIYLDTHVVAWLYAGDLERLSTKVKLLIEENDLLISPAVMLELQFLKEIGKLKDGANKILSRMNRSLGLNQCELPFTSIVQEALNQDWTRDPFDRLIVAQGKLRGVPLLTKDRSILDNYSGALW